jgi:hypothetical protein
VVFHSQLRDLAGTGQAAAHPKSPGAEMRARFLEFPRAD